MTAQGCPVCDELALVHEAPGVFRCEHCRARIVQGQLQCPSCQTMNPINAEVCSACSEPLTVFGRVLLRQGSQLKSQRTEQMRSRAGEIQAQAHASSEERMAGFRELDQRRIESERQASLAQKERDRRLFRNVAVGLGLFLLAIVVVSLVVLL